MILEDSKHVSPKRVNEECEYGCVCVTYVACTYYAQQVL